MEYLVFAYLLVRMLCTDGLYAVRGKTSPRQAIRMEQVKQRGATGRGGGGDVGGYFADLATDAAKGARERRQLAGQRKSDHRRAKAQRRQESTAQRDERRGDRHHQKIARKRERDADHRRVNPSDFPDEPARPAPVASPRDRDGPEPAAPTAPGSAARPPAAEPTTRPATPTNNGGAMTQPDAEITGQQSAITFAEQMADWLHGAVTSTEQGIANLEAGGVSGEPITELTNAMELLTAAVDGYKAAATRLAAHTTVTEAYAANPDAGDRAFVTSE